MTKEDAIKEIDELRNDIGSAYDDADQSPMWYALGMAIDALQERKTGRWIYHVDEIFPAESTKECDQCRTEQPISCDDKYCPWCGAKMEACE